MFTVPALLTVKTISTVAGLTAVAGGATKVAKAKSEPMEYYYSSDSDDENDNDDDNDNPSRKDNKESLRILFLSSDTGGGHRASAESLANQFQLIYGAQGIKVKYHLMDIIRLDGIAPYNNLNWWYKHLSAHPNQWKIVYGVSNTRAFEAVSDVHLKVMCERGIRRRIASYRPDVVISVHPLMNNVPVLSCTRISEETHQHLPMFTVVTDLGSAHSSWFTKGRIENIFVGSQQIHDIAVNRSKIQTDKLKLIGLPIRHDFAVQAEKIGESRDGEQGRDYQLQIRQKLNLPHTNKKTILIMGGGEGCGALSNIVDALYFEMALRGMDATLLVVCGRNEILKQSLQDRDWDHQGIIKKYIRKRDKYLRKKKRKQERDQMRKLRDDRINKHFNETTTGQDTADGSSEDDAVHAVKENWHKLVLRQVVNKNREMQNRVSQLQIMKHHHKTKRAHHYNHYQQHMQKLLHLYLNFTNHSSVKIKRIMADPNNQTKTIATSTTNNDNASTRGNNNNGLSFKISNNIFNSIKKLSNNHTSQNNVVENGKTKGKNEAAPLAATTTILTDSEDDNDQYRKKAKDEENCNTKHNKATPTTIAATTKDDSVDNNVTDDTKSEGSDNGNRDVHNEQFSSAQEVTAASEECLEQNNVVFEVDNNEQEQQQRCNIFSNPQNAEELDSSNDLTVAESAIPLIESTSPSSDHLNEGKSQIMGDKEQEEEKKAEAEVEKTLRTHDENIMVNEVEQKQRYHRQQQHQHQEDTLFGTEAHDAATLESDDFNNLGIEERNVKHQVEFTGIDENETDMDCSARDMDFSARSMDFSSRSIPSLEALTEGGRRGEVDVIGLGFVTNIAEYMVAADILVSKAGPGTISEAAALALPVMLTSFLPGQEEGNVDFVLNGNFGAYIPDNQPIHIAEEVCDWCSNDDKLKELSDNAKLCGTPYAARDIAKQIGDSTLRWKEINLETKKERLRLRKQQDEEREKLQKEKEEQERLHKEKEEQERLQKEEEKEKLSEVCTENQKISDNGDSDSIGDDAQKNKSPEKVWSKVIKWSSQKLKEGVDNITTSSDDEKIVDNDSNNTSDTNEEAYQTPKEKVWSKVVKFSSKKLGVGFDDTDTTAASDSISQCADNSSTSNDKPEAVISTDGTTNTTTIATKTTAGQNIELRMTKPVIPNDTTSNYE